uniref:N-acetylgalactosaminide beta-1,3-galactosyltransferase n=1 Tax=Saccoglossus kowalevskii TaxID=10224 RepID=A0ABM0GJR0_SACKO|nr:PREDICTED: glycoprotein-N-acetylgalactosamine 3-beta-galactosyltransferase 1-like [Saccoglossus kowalevskii]
MTSDSRTSTRKAVILLIVFLPVMVFLVFAYGGYRHSVRVKVFMDGSGITNSSVVRQGLPESSIRFPKPLKIHSLPLSNFSEGLAPASKIEEFPSVTVSPHCIELLAAPVNIVPTSRDDKMDIATMDTTPITLPKLTEKVRILCWLATNPNYAVKRLPHVINTWGSRCDKMVYFSSFEDNDVPIVKLDIPEGPSFLWGKTKAAFAYIYKNYFNDYDWFLKADDDSFIIIENLRYFLQQYDTSQPLYFGHKLVNHRVNQTFNSGGAGYVLSKSALRRFVECGIPNPSKCSPINVGKEDLEMAKCLEKLGVVMGDTRDPLGRQRFIPFITRLTYQVTWTRGIMVPWFIPIIRYSTFITGLLYADKGEECCSDYVISFHYLKPDQMEVLDYLIYHVRLYLVTGDGTFT